jgi:hypothetical protein
MKEWIWRLICPILELSTQCLLHFLGNCKIDENSFAVTVEGS